MFKRLLIFTTLILVIQVFTNAQSVYWEETFDTTPVGWELEGNWSFSPGTLIFYYYPVNLNYDYSAVSAVITLPANAGDMVVNQFLDIFEPSVTAEQSQISVIHDGGETVLWTYQNNLGDWGSIEGTPITFPVNQFAGQDIQVKFRTWGPTTDAWNSWTLYTLSLTSYFDNDLAATEIYGPTCVTANVPATWEIMVKNTGLNAQSGFTVGLFSYTSGESLGTVYVTTPLELGQTGLYEISFTPEEVMNTCLYAFVNLPSDENPGNNRSGSHFLRVKPEEIYNVLFWDNDNGIETITNPESGLLEQSQTGLAKALNQAGIMYEYTSLLPADLTPYDLVISTMGCYCLS
jgi:hypothetical protein